MIVFVVVAPFVVFRSLGYRFGQLGELFTWIQTGGIYIHSNINNATVYLNDEYVESSGLWLRNTLMQDLEPGRSYEVVVQKPGLQDWRKTLPVYPSLVTEARVLMMPVDVEADAVYPYIDVSGVGTTTPIVSTSTGVMVEPVAEYLTLVALFAASSTDADGDTTPADVAGGSLATTTENVPEYFHRLGVVDPTSLQNVIIDGDQVSWLSRGDVLVHWVDENKIPPYYYCISTTECRSKIVLNWDSDIIAFNFLPGRDDVLVVLVDDGLYAVEVDDRSARNIQPIYLGKDLQFRIDDRDRIIVSDGGVFYILDL